MSYVGAKKQLRFQLQKRNLARVFRNHMLRKMKDHLSITYVDVHFGREWSSSELQNMI